MPKRNQLAEDNEFLRKRLEEIQSKRTWIPTDHLCMECQGGRILECETGQGMSPGGNPLYMCANCETMNWGMGPPFCWCNFRFKNQHEQEYMCMAFKVIDEFPQFKEAFRSCGSEPPPPWGTNKKAGPVGILTHSAYRQARQAN